MALFCDGIGSTVRRFVRRFAEYVFSQNVGLVAMTKMVNRKALACGALS